MWRVIAVLVAVVGVLAVGGRLADEAFGDDEPTPNTQNSACVITEDAVLCSDGE